jgi:hypothetical protein
VAAYLSEELVVRYPSAAVTYFFCKDKEDVCRPNQIIRTVLAQACAASELVTETAAQVWVKDLSIRNLSADDCQFHDKLLVPTLQALARNKTDRVFIVLDGVNELPTPTLSRVLKLIQMLQTLHNRSNVLMIRIVITSQPFGSDDSGLSLGGAVAVSLTSENFEDNVASFAKARLTDDLRIKFEGKENQSC